MGDRPRIVLDTDIGTDVDDAIALTLAARSPEINLAAVTTNYGDAMLRARIARKFLLLLGREDVPVAAGLGQPLLQRVPAWMAGYEGEGILGVGEEPPGVSTEHAVDLIASLAKAEGRLHLVCIGAMTNAAAFLLLHPHLKSSISEIVLMGGAFRPVFMDDVEIPPYRETNLNNDPDAARVLFDADVPLRIVPAEVTFKAFLHRASLERLRTAGTPATKSLAVMTDLYSRFVFQSYTSHGGATERFADKSVLLHDPLALTSLIRPDLLRFERLRARIESRPDGKLYTVPCSKGGTEVEVAVAADYAAFEEFLMERLVTA